MRSIAVMFALVLGSSTFAQTNSTSNFFANVGKLCGARFSGEMTFPEDGMDSFTGKKLVARFLSCDETEIQIAFDVGEDRSRTWFLRKSEQGLVFKHRHLLADGSIDPVSNYGGSSNEQGSEYQQSFPADEFTQQLIPPASTNVWNLKISEDLTTLTYHLERHEQSRFTAVLRRDD